MAHHLTSCDTEAMQLYMMAKGNVFNKIPVDSPMTAQPKPWCCWKASGKPAEITGLKVLFTQMEFTLYLLSILYQITHGSGKITLLDRLIFRTL